MPNEVDVELERERLVMLDLISACSEDRWAAGWMSGIDKELHEQGGLWEILGRALGWPLGYRGEDGWVAWDEATAYYANRGRKVP